MVAFNFREWWADDVASGKKPSTIRKTKRCEIGDTVQLYTGQRTKKCRKLGEGICIGLAKITITDECPYAESEKQGTLKPDVSVPLFAQEGFKNAKEFQNFFRNQYGLPFTGWLHVWRLTHDK